MPRTISPRYRRTRHGHVRTRDQSAQGGLERPDAIAMPQEFSFLENSIGIGGCEWDKRLTVHRYYTWWVATSTVSAIQPLETHAQMDGVPAIFWRLKTKIGKLCLRSLSPPTKSLERFACKHMTLPSPKWGNRLAGDKGYLQQREPNQWVFCIRRPSAHSSHCYNRPYPIFVDPTFL